MGKANKIPDRKKEEIKQLLAEGHAKNYVAKRAKVSWSTVDKVSKEESDSLENLREHKKTQWIDEAWSAINKYMHHVQKDDVVNKTNARDSAILIGTLHDKMLKSKELQIKQEELDIKRKEQEGGPSDQRVVIINDKDAMRKAMNEDS